MRSIVLSALVAAFLVTGLSAQEFRPMPAQQPKPLKLPSVDEVKKELEAAKALLGTRPPSGEQLTKVVGYLDGEPITLDMVLDEVMIKYGSPLVPLLAQQALMKMEVMKRGIKVTGKEFLEEVRYYKAQSASKIPIKEQLEKGKKGWDWFVDSITTRAAMNKMVRADQNITTPGPPNQFLLQIWAGGVGKKYQVEMKKEALPPNCLARVQTTWGLDKVLREIVDSRVAGKPYSVVKEISEDGSGEMLEFRPASGVWPRFYIPNVKVKVTRFSGGGPGQSEMTAEDLLNLVVEGKGTVSERLLIFEKGGQTPVTNLPCIEVAKRVAKNRPVEKVSLQEAIDAVLKTGAVVDKEARMVRSKDGTGPEFTIPDETGEDFRTSQKIPVMDILSNLAGSKHTASTVLLLSRKGDPDFVMLPLVPVVTKTMIDRSTALDFFFGSLKLAQFQDSLKSFARLKAVKKAFAGYLPGIPRTGEPNAPWGVITVNEEAVANRIKKERKKYEGSIFPWEMICKILNKTVPEEMRRFWVGNGVDQIIGADVDDATLKKYFDENVENFGVATVEANHILIQKMDEKTGCINWEEARKMAEKVIAMIQTGGAKFEALAKKYSEDPATKDKGGDLGLFTLVSRYDYDLCKAIFAMQPGEISSKPVKTKLGYHVIKLRKKTPPDLKKYGFDSKGKKEDVREFRQQRRRDNWLEENIYSKFKLETLLQDILK